LQQAENQRNGEIGRNSWGCKQGCGRQHAARCLLYGSGPRTVVTSQLRERDKFTGAVQGVNLMPAA
jgi:hypothetical protein